MKNFKIAALALVIAASFAACGGAKTETTDSVSTDSIATDSIKTDSVAVDSAAADTAAKM